MSKQKAPKMTKSPSSTPRSFKKPRPLAHRNSAAEFPARPFIDAGVKVPSLGAMSRGSGVSLSLISLILSGQRMLGYIVAFRLAGFLGLSMERLGLMLYSEGGLVPKDSPIMKRLAKHGFPAKRTNGDGHPDR